jgi:ubiquinone/menaquinone biosynthesis C-methylase UbiE
MKELLRFAPWKNTDTLVSLGSGSGWWEINCVIHQPAGQLILVDHDFQILTNEEVSDSISYFESKTQTKNTTTISVKNEDVHALTLENEMANWVLIFNALHEFKQIDLVLKEAFRILKKGGRLLIEEEISISIPLIHEGCGKKLFFAEELMTIVTEAGFEKIDKMQKDEKAIYILFKK